MEVVHVKSPIAGYCHTHFTREDANSGIEYGMKFSSMSFLNYMYTPCDHYKVE